MVPVGEIGCAGIISPVMLMCPLGHRGAMENLEDIAADLEAYLDEKERVREDMLKRSREVTRLSARTIAAMHRGAFVDGDVLRITDMTRELRKDLEAHKDIWHSGALENALQEAAEAAIVHALLKGERLPHPDDLSVTVPSYLLGLCDSVGELRRFTLTALKEGHYPEAEAHLESMDRIYEVVSQYHYPKAIVPVKVKQDQIRGIIERTRGDVAMAIAGHRAASRMETAGKEG
jgi:translin